VRNKSKLILLIFSFLLPIVATAKKIDFGVSKGGFGFWAGVTRQTNTTLAPLNQSSSPANPREYGVEIFFTLGDRIFLRPNFSILNTGIISALGTDSVGNRAFTQLVDGKSMMYGTKISLVPIISDDELRRIYFGGGFHIAKLSGDIVRSYLDGSNEKFTEKFAGSSTSWEFHVGIEFFLVQNYSLSFEAGYRKLSYSEITHDGGSDLRGNLVDDGTALKDENNKLRTLSMNDPFINLVFRLHF